MIPGILLVSAVLFSINLFDDFKGDELNSIIHATSGKTLPDFNKFPFYHYYLGFLSSIDSSEMFLRLFGSVIFSLGAVYFFYILCRTRLGEQTSILCGFLLVIAPEFVLKGAELRMYPFMFMCIAASANFLLARNYPWYFVFICLGIVSHPLFLLNVTVHLLWMVHKRDWIFLVLLMTFACIVVLPWLEIFLKVMGATVNYMHTPDKLPYGFPLKIGYGFFSLTLGETVLPTNLVVVIPAVVGFSMAAVWGIIHLYKTDRDFMLFTLGWLLFPLVVIAASPRMNSKFVFFLSGMPFLILVGCGLVASKLKPALLVLLPVCLSLFNLFAEREYHNMALVGSPREVARYLESTHRGMPIVASGDYTAIRYYLDRSIKITDLKRIKEPPDKCVFLRGPMSSKHEVYLSKFNIQNIRNFTYDPDFRIKQEYLARQFWEYRVQVYELEKNPEK